jgi:hypothetical protein
MFPHSRFSRWGGGLPASWPAYFAAIGSAKAGVTLLTKMMKLSFLNIAESP